MIEQSTFLFLKELKNNNNRDWFNDNRKVYENARDNFADFIGELIQDIQKLDPFITNVTAKNTVFRVFKDVRFSKNKDPYKTYFSAAISKNGKNELERHILQFVLELLRLVEKARVRGELSGINTGRHFFRRVSAASIVQSKPRRPVKFVPEMGPKRTLLGAVFR